MNRLLQKAQISGQLIRYLVAGGFVLALDYGTLLTLAGPWRLHYLLSAAIAFLLAESVSFFLSLYWVFEVKSNVHRGMLYLMFQCSGLIGLLLTLAGVYYFSDNLLVSQVRELLSNRLHIAIPFYLLPKAITTLLVFIWNFFTKKWLLSGHPEQLMRWVGCKKAERQ
jgi:putative flippase GtrA